VLAVLLASHVFSTLLKSQVTAHNPLRIGLLTALGTNPNSTAIERGVRLGAAEAKQTANLFGNDVQLFEAPGGPDPIASATQLLSRRKVQVLIGSSPADIEALSKFAERQHILFLNVASRAADLRAACRRYTFHIEGSDPMYAAAARMALASSDAPVQLARSAQVVDSTVLWVSMLQRYGASQINDRFRARYGTPMDAGGWAGWAAVKISSEAALRSGSNEASKLAGYLESPGTSFDGHKGWPLTFRLSDHQLRQPLYVAIHESTGAHPETFRDVPELRPGVAAAPHGGEAKLDRMLDRLIPVKAGGCKWTH
jgi:ABC-type branched-subunit amino acid transport system substrate-binding protein